MSPQAAREALHNTLTPNPPVDLDTVSTRFVTLDYRPTWDRSRPYLVMSGDPGTPGSYDWTFLTTEGLARTTALEWAMEDADKLGQDVTLYDVIRMKDQLFPGG